MTREERRAVATEFVESVNSKTFCAHCGAQPIEWHGEHHSEKPNARVSSLRTQGASIARIKREMEICVPLCRRCHMKEDGRGAALFVAQPRQPGSVFVDPEPCGCCGKLTKPTRKGLCSGCYNHQTGLRLRKKFTVCGCNPEV